MGEGSQEWRTSKKKKSLGVSQGKGNIVGGSVGGDADKLTKL